MAKKKKPTQKQKPSGKGKKKPNNDKQLSEETSLTLIKNVMSTISEAQNLPKLYQIGLLHQAGYNPKDIEVILDTSAKYASVCIAKIKKESKTRHRLAEIIAAMPDWFRTSRQATLPVLAAAQNQALQHYLDNPELLIDKPQLAKQLATQAGVRSEDDKPFGIVKIESLRVVQNILQQDQDRVKQIPADVVDAEIVEDETDK